MDSTPRGKSKMVKPGLTPKQLELRRGIIGGTDAPAILGLSSWRSRWDVYAEKVGEAAETEPSDAALWGLLLEPVVRARYEVETGRKLRAPRRLIRHPERRWQAGHLDGLDDDLVYEGKTARFADGWGEPGTDEIPPDYKVQVWHYMAVTGRRRADVAVLIGGQDFRIYTVEWDEDAIAELTAEENEFLQTHILPRVPPEPDGSSGGERWIRRRYPEDNGSELVAMPEQYALLADFVKARRRKELWGEQEARLRQTIMLAMGDASRMLSPMVKITYARSRDSEQVDYKSYTRHLEGLLSRMGESEDDIAATRGLYTSPKPGQRQFRVYVPQVQLEARNG